MCGIAGMCSFAGHLQAESVPAALQAAAAALHHRGPDANGIWRDDHVGLVHTRLAIIDPKGAPQPMVGRLHGRTGTLVYNGELYNSPELRAHLAPLGWDFNTSSDTEVLLCGLLAEGDGFLPRLNGIFAFAFWDGESLLLVRDRLGVKPLFFAQSPGGLLRFGSEPKALFALGFVPKLNQNSLRELFALGPAHTPGHGVFAGLHELLPGEWLRLGAQGTKRGFFWQLQSRPHTDDEDSTVAQVRFLLQDSTQRQMVSDVPLCTFLSGGLDSSVLTAICADQCARQGRPLHTFSFEFKGNDAYYKANAFQPTQDEPFALAMAAHLQTQHTTLHCDPEALADWLDPAMQARDLPGMADVDASLLYFCHEVSRDFKVAITGETADEIFGGYPWFRSEAAFAEARFPWSDMAARHSFLRDDVLDELQLDAYANEAYVQSIAETPTLPGEPPQDARRREIAWLNLRWFMQTLLDRMDRMSMACGLEARVPFADHRILDYVWNIPWRLKYQDGHEKHLLRRAAEGWLPHEVLWRRKSPYPKTYHPAYEAALAARMRELLCNPNAPLLQFVDPHKAEAFLRAPADYGKPWYGQLMAAPQRIAWFLQLNTFLLSIKE